MPLSSWLDEGRRSWARIYLSPHHDDIAFSLGSFLDANPGGTLINLFTRSNYLASLPVRHDATADEIERVMAVRKGEDRMFAEAVRLKRIDLDLDDAPVAKRDPFDASSLDADLRQLAALPQMLDGLVKTSDGPRLLFCPAAIGGHANHVATREFVLRNRQALQANFTILFYEDLPYASGRRGRAAGLGALHQEMRPERPTRLVWPVDIGRSERKLELISLYASQHGKVPESLRYFTPRAWRPSGPHEAVWAFG